METITLEILTSKIAFLIYGILIKELYNCIRAAIYNTSDTWELIKKHYNVNKNVLNKLKDDKWLLLRDIYNDTVFSKVNYKYGYIRSTNLYVKFRCNLLRIYLTIKLPLIKLGLHPAYIKYRYYDYRIQLLEAKEIKRKINQTIPGFID